MSDCARNHACDVLCAREETSVLLCALREAYGLVRWCGGGFVDASMGLV